MLDRFKARLSETISTIEKFERHINEGIASVNMLHGAKKELEMWIHELSKAAEKAADTNKLSDGA